jgi:hypothetical protein
MMLAYSKNGYPHVLCKRVVDRSISPALKQTTKGLFATIALIIFTSFMLFSNEAKAQVGDGARAYFPPPINSNILTFYQIKLNGNTPGANGTVSPGFDGTTDLSILQYNRGFDLWGKYASVAAVLPYSAFSGTLDTPIGSRSVSQSGWADASLIATIGLKNLPPFDREEWLKFDPGFSVGGIVQWTPPTGEYDQANVVNIGSNRHSLRIGGIFYYLFGQTFHDSNLATVEFIPSLTFFSDNNEATGGGSKSQDPLLKLEGHATKNFNRHFWASLDFLGMYGGETQTRGVNDGNSQDALGAGVTLAGVYKGVLTAKLTYGKIVTRSDGGLDGDSLRFNLNLVF